MEQFGNIIEWLRETLIPVCVRAHDSDNLIQQVNISWFSWTNRVKSSIDTSVYNTDRTAWAHLPMIISKQLNLNWEVDKNNGW